jgi:hypothetical protein
MAFMAFMAFKVKGWGLGRWRAAVEVRKWTWISTISTM